MEANMGRLRLTPAVMIIILLGTLLGAVCFAQEKLPNGPQPQNVPDAPSATKPSTFPSSGATVPSRPVSPSDQQPATPPPATDQQQESAPPPSSQVKTVPSGTATKGQSSGHDELETTIRVNVNFVLVPVTVKDDTGRPIYGLTKDDFFIREDGERKAIRFFTSDPFPISAAVVIDVSMPDVAYRKVNETLSALTCSFSEFDELAVYTYGNTVKQQQDFAAALSKVTDATFRKMKDIRGQQGGVTVNQGPMAAGPSVNNRPFDPSVPNPATQNTRSLQSSQVLNDAILRAAVDLSKRPRDRRKVIFVISEGREDGSTASYSDVLKVLLSNEVQVYAVATGSAAVPGYGTLNKIRLPRQGYGNILPKYANATGGDVLTESSRDAIERAYATLTQEARNQYTIGYNSSPSQSGSYRSIEVVVAHPNVKVFARDGYYPLPPVRK
jgi:VWFA-related protein